MVREHFWYRRSVRGWLLLPISGLYCLLIRLRRMLYLSGRLEQTRMQVPVVIVGNIAVGGTGKTPLVIALAQYLASIGWQPGIISRGYGGRRLTAPRIVGTDSDPSDTGDEPVMITRQTGCPLVVFPERTKAAALLLSEYPAVDVIISDDGLQHLALARDLEIVVVDAVRRHGNGFCLPAGPLREPQARLDTVDFVVFNGAAGDEHWHYLTELRECVNLATSERRTLDSFTGVHCSALAGIGNPERFFGLLRTAGLDITAQAFPDHHRFTTGDLAGFTDRPLLMTDKDAVKIGRLDMDLTHCWSVRQRTELSAGLAAAVADRLVPPGGRQGAVS